MDALIHIPMLDLRAQYASIRNEIQAAIEQVLESQAFILGSEVEALERELAEYSGCAYGIGVSSGTDALLASLMAIGIHTGDEVITTAYSFFATAGAVVRLGGRPVFVDICPGTFNLDPAGIAAKITSQTRAILPVHLCGGMADMQPILEIAREHNLYVIEDAAQAIGSEYQGKRAGSLGHLGCFSFYPSKNLGGYGDSGMIVTNAAHLADRVTLLRNHGHRPKYFNLVVGGNFRMDAIQAAVLRVKFRYLDQWTAARQQRAATYRDLFQQAGLVLEPGDDCQAEGRRGIILPFDAGSDRHIYHLFMIRVDRREVLMAFLKQRGIASEVYYPCPLHLQECFAYLGYRPGDLPASERASRESLALPVYPELTVEMQTSVVEAIADFVNGRR